MKGDNQCRIKQLACEGSEAINKAPNSRIQRPDVGLLSALNQFYGRTEIMSTCIYAAPVMAVSLAVACMKTECSRRTYPRSGHAIDLQIGWQQLGGDPIYDPKNFIKAANVGVSPESCSTLA